MPPMLLEDSMAMASNDVDMPMIEKVSFRFGQPAPVPVEDQSPVIRKDFPESWFHVDLDDIGLVDDSSFDLFYVFSLSFLFVGVAQMLDFRSHNSYIT